MVMDIVAPIVLLFSFLGVGWVVWRIVDTKRRQAELEGQAHLADAEARKWEAMTKATAADVRDRPRGQQ